MRVADYVFKYLKEYGVKDIFMLSGGGAMYLNDALKKSDLNYICNLHEQAASIAACGYAQYNNSLGVCLVTTGPGGTNAVTGVASAWLDSIPVLFISGQVKTVDLKHEHLRQRGIQEVDICSMVNKITNYSAMLKNPHEIKYCLSKAISCAVDERPSPVWLDIPLDMQSADIDEHNLIEYVCINSHKLYPYLQDQVTQAVELINQSSKPIIIVGNGVRSYDGISLVKDLATSYNIPIITTWKAADMFDEEFANYCGRSGIVGQRGANIAQQESDLILSIGARLDIGQIGYDQNKFAPNAKKIVVDIDYSEVNKLYRADLRICAYVSDFLKQLNDMSITVKDIHWLARCKYLQKHYPTVLPKYYDYDGYADKQYVNTYALIDCLSKSMKDNDILVPSSSGSAAEITMQAFKVKQGQRVINMPALGAMGFGICTAIGVAVASGKRVVCVEGDGSFAMNTQELETIRRLRLPIKIFVLNNRGYASIRNTQRSYFKDYIGCDSDSGLTLPSTHGIAEAYGIKYAKIYNNFRLEYWVDEWLNDTDDIPYIIEVMVDPDQQTMPKVISKLNEDGQYDQNDFSRMWPECL